MATHLVDLKNTCTITDSLVPATRTSTSNGTGVDLQLFEGPVFGFLHLGAVDFTTGDETYAFKFQESADNSTNWTDITGAVFTYAAATDSTTSSNHTEIINIPIHAKRYVRAVATLGGTTPSALGSVGVLGRKKIAGGSGVLAV